MLPLKHSIICSNAPPKTPHYLQQCNIEDHNWVPLVDDTILHCPPPLVSTEHSMIPVLLAYEKLDKVNDKVPCSI